MPKAARTRIELACSELIDAFTVKCIGSTFGSEINDSTVGPAIFGFKTAALHLNFREEFERDVVGATERSVKCVRHFDTVDNENIFRSAGAIYGNTADTRSAGLGF